MGKKEDNIKAEQILYNSLLQFSINYYDADMFSITSLKFNKLVNDILDDKIGTYKTDDYHLLFAEVNENKIIGHNCGAGYFYTKHIHKITEVLPFINKKVQTISYFGISRYIFSELIYRTVGSGCDRIVPIGNALDFDYIWDGYNLLDELTSKKKII
jgi:hypothetical protein